MPSQPTITFLDTNALHYARLYLQWASSDEQKFPPFNPCELVLKDALARECDDHLVAGLTNGAWVIRHLLLECQADADSRAEYSPMNRMELASGNLRGRAIANAAEPGMPERWWTRLLADDIRPLLATTDHADVVCSPEDLEEEFGLAGIGIYETRPTVIQDAWRLSAEILSHVYMETNDALIYAAAAVVGAKELVTYDGGLKSLANGLRNPCAAAPDHVREQYRAAREATLAFLATAETPSVIVPLPKPVKGTRRDSDWPPLLADDVEEA